MGSNISLTNLSNLTNQPTAIGQINNNNASITAAFSDVLSRSGVASNQMQATLDMNSNRIVNLSSPVSLSEPVTLGYLNGVSTSSFSGTTNVPVSAAMQPVVNASSTTTAISLLGLRVQLSSGTTYYVSNSGSDSNSGLSVGAPFQTIQKAVNTLCNNLDARGFGGTIQIANGTYNENVLAAVPTAFITFEGNAGSPSSVIVQSITAQNGAILTVNDLMIQNPSGQGLVAILGGGISFSNLVFGNCQTDQMAADRHGWLLCTTNYSINGSPGGGVGTNSTGHIHAAHHGNVRLIGVTINILSNMTVTSTTGGFAYAYALGDITAQGCTINLNTHTVTGRQYTVDANAIIYTAGAGTGLFPGTVSGFTENGGQYV